MKIAVKVRQEQTGVYRAWCPALPGCTARGQTFEEVKAGMDKALRAYLSSLNVIVPPGLEQEVLTT